MPSLSTPAAVLRPALATLKPIVSKNIITPIMECVLVSVSKSGSFLRGTDLDTTLQIPLDVQGEDMTFAVPFAFFSAAVESAGSNDVSISFNEEAMSVQIIAGLNTHKASCFAGENFPKPVPMPSSTPFVVDGSALAAALNQVRPIACRNNPRPAMNGVCLWMLEGGCVAVATGDATISRSPVIAGIAEVPNGQVSLNQKAAQALADFSFGEDVLLVITQHMLWAEAAGSTLAVRLVDGRFPDWTAVVPSYSTGFSVSRGVFADAVKTVAIAAGMEGIVSLELSNDKLAVSASDDMIGRSAEAIVDVQEQDCPDFTSNVTGRLLLECIGSISGDVLQLKTDGAYGSPIVLSSEGVDRLTLINPLRKL